MSDKLHKLIWPIARNMLITRGQPFFGTFVVTWRCNARCIMCTVWEKTKFDDLDQDQIKHMFQKLNMLKVIRLTGGEPFLRSDLADIVNDIKENTNAQIVHITSNGFLTDAMGEFVKRKKHDNVHIKISLNGTGENYDRVMGVPGAYSKITNSFETLARLKDKYSFFLGVNQTITDWESYQDSKNIRRLCREFSVPYLPVIAYEKEIALYDKDEKKTQNDQITFVPYGKFNEEQIKIIINDFLDDARKIKNTIERAVKQYYLNGLYNRLIKEKDTPNPHCVALRNHIRILPNGDIPVCLHNSHVVGNIHRQDLKTIWSSAEINKKRKWVDACKGCWAECEVIPSAIFSPLTIPHFLASLWNKA